MDTYLSNRPSLCAITATHGRHHMIERIVRYFLEQDYKGDSLLLIYNNSEVEQVLDDIRTPLNKRIILINQCRDSKTGENYTNLGAIYNDAFSCIPSNVDVVCHMDDDDGYLPNHFSAGIEGWQKAISYKKKAYKPAQSWYRHAGGVEKVSNTLEPSIFISYDHIHNHGYSLETGFQHSGWYTPLLALDLLLVENSGEPTLIYTFDGKYEIWKTSGDMANPKNFENCRTHSQNHGDGVISPVPVEVIQQFYV